MKIRGEHKDKSSDQTQKRLLMVLLVVLVGLLALRLVGPVQGYLSKSYYRYTSSLQVLKLDLNFENYQRIQGEIQELQGKSVADRTSAAWVPASVSYLGTTYRAKVKLKGTFGDHWRDGRWSLNVKLKRGGSIQGMSEFSLMPPDTREYLDEFIFQRALKEVGLIFHRLFFVDMVVNGESHGVYTLMERSSKLTIENSLRREGPLLQYDKRAFVEHLNQRRFDRDPFVESYSRPANSGDYKKQEKLKREYEQAASMLDGFKDGRLDASRVFDLESLAKSFAIYALLGAWEYDWKDVFFFYNTVTGKIEIVAKEIHTNQASGNWWLGEERNPFQRTFIQRLFEDQYFVEAYAGYLNEYLNKNFVGNLKVKMHEEIVLKSNQLRRDNYGQPKIEDPWGKMFVSAERVKALLFSEFDVQVSIKQLKDSSVLSVSTYSFFDLSNVQLLSEGREYNYDEVRIPSSYNEKRVVLLPLPSDINTMKPMYFRYQLGDQVKALSVPVRVRRAGRTGLLAGYSSIKELERYFDFDSKRLRFYCREGVNLIDTLLVFPELAEFYCSSSSSIRLGKGGGLIFSNSLNLVGSEKQKLNVLADAGAGGIVVINSPSPSLIQNVEFENLGAIVNDQVNVTGGVSFYESDLILKNSVFIGGQSGDDVVNVVRSKIDFENVKIIDSLYDSIDLDFVTGRLTGVRVENAGNDGLDVSGSTLIIDGLVVDGAGDKSLSVGEASSVLVSGSKFMSSLICVASKDGSKVTLKNSLISGCGIGLSAYIKKSEFGGGALVVQNLSRKDVDVVQSVDEQSTIRWIN